MRTVALSSMGRSWDGTFEDRQGAMPEPGTLTLELTG
jgi:hypothetical protein